MNILFTCVGRRTYLINYFRENLNAEDKIIATDMQLSAPALTAADIALKVPEVYNPKYTETILDICIKHDVNAIIPLNDLELPILSENRNTFLNYNIIPIVSPPLIIDICFDKFRTSQFIESIGLNSPKTFFNLQDAIRDIDDNKLSFPLVLKPRWGSGSIGIEYVNDKKELIQSYELLKTKIYNSILSRASTSENYILIQECIKGKEYGVDIMNDLGGNNRGISIKQKLAMRAGETDKAITVKNEKIYKISKLIASRLKHIGNLDIDLLEFNGEFYVLELNPRFGGGFPFSYEAGVNFPAALIQWIKGNDIDNNILIPQYNKAFAKCDYLVSIPEHEKC